MPRPSRFKSDDENLKIIVDKYLPDEPLPNTKPSSDLSAGDLNPSRLKSMTRDELGDLAMKMGGEAYDAMQKDYDFLPTRAEIAEATQVYKSYRDKYSTDGKFDYEKSKKTLVDKAKAKAKKKARNAIMVPFLIGLIGYMLFGSSIFTFMATYRLLAFDNVMFYKYGKPIEGISKKRLFIANHGGLLLDKNTRKVVGIGANTKSTFANMYLDTNADKFRKALEAKGYIVEFEGTTFKGIRAPTGELLEPSSRYIRGSSFVSGIADDVLSDVYPNGITRRLNSRVFDNGLKRSRFVFVDKALGAAENVELDARQRLRQKLRKSVALGDLDEDRILQLLNAGDADSPFEIREGEDGSRVVYDKDTGLPVDSGGKAVTAEDLERAQKISDEFSDDLSGRAKAAFDDISSAGGSGDRVSSKIGSVQDLMDKYKSKIGSNGLRSGAAIVTVGITATDVACQIKGLLNKVDNTSKQMTGDSLRRFSGKVSAAAGQSQDGSATAEEVGAMSSILFDAKSPEDEIQRSNGWQSAVLGVTAYGDRAISGLTHDYLSIAGLTGFLATLQENFGNIPDDVCKVVQHPATTIAVVAISLLATAATSGVSAFALAAGAGAGIAGTVVQGMVMAYLEDLLVNISVGDMINLKDGTPAEVGEAAVGGGLLNYDDTFRSLGGQAYNTRSETAKTIEKERVESVAADTASEPFLKRLFDPKFPVSLTAYAALSAPSTPSSGIKSATRYAFLNSGVSSVFRRDGALIKYASRIIKGGSVYAAGTGSSALSLYSSTGHGFTSEQIDKYANPLENDTYINSSPERQAKYEEFVKKCTQSSTYADFTAEICNQGGEDAARFALHTLDTGIMKGLAATTNSENWNKQLAGLGAASGQSAQSTTASSSTDLQTIADGPPVPESDTVEVPELSEGARVHKALAPTIVQMLNDAKAAGINMGGSGWRDTERQKELRIINGCPDVDKSPPSSCDTETAIPGSSMHERGVALDLNCNSGSAFAFRGTPCEAWMKQNASKYGLINLPSEAWHWSVTGG
jgi:hypothetical protein